MIDLDEVKERQKDCGKFVLEGKKDDRWNRISRHPSLGEVKVVLSQMLTSDEFSSFRVRLGTDGRVIHETDRVDPMPQDWYDDLKHSE
jgi:hypothetical protein